MKDENKGMEFLMTYGWAILAGIVVIAVLVIYFNPNQMNANQPNQKSNAEKFCFSMNMTLDDWNGNGVDMREITEVRCWNDLGDGIFEQKIFSGNFNKYWYDSKWKNRKHIENETWFEIENNRVAIADKICEWIYNGTYRWEDEYCYYSEVKK